MSDGELRGRTLLQRFADRADVKGRKFMSEEEAQTNALLWQQDRDEQALERLFENYALLIVRRTNHFKKINESIVSPEDIDAWALGGAWKAIEGYDVDETDEKLITYVVNGVVWNVLSQLKAYRAPNAQAQDEASKLIREASQQKGRDLSTMEEREILDTISPKFHEVYYSRKMGATITSGALIQERLSQHPSSDASSELQYFFNDGMDRFADGNALPLDLAVERERLKEDVDEVLRKLTPRERIVIQGRYGVGLVDILSSGESGYSADAWMTLEDIGSVLDVSKERVRKIEGAALRKLKNPFWRDPLNDYVQDSEHLGHSVRVLEDHEISAMEDEAFETFLELNAD